MTEAPVTTGSDAAPVSTDATETVSQAPPVAPTTTATPATTEGTADKPAAAATTVKTVQDDAAAKETPVEPTWRDDWREKLAGTDEKLLARLKRYASLENWARASNELYQRMSAGELKPVLDPKASPEETAAYRKAWGIPEKIEKPEDYGLSWPTDYKPSEADTATLNSFMGAMQQAHAPPGIVKEAFGWWQAEQAKVEQQLYEAAVAQTIANKVEIKAEHGRDYDANVRIGERDLVAVLGAEGAKELTAVTLADGTKLGDYPQFVRYITGSGRRIVGDGPVAQGDVHDSGKPLEDQIAAALDLKFSDEKKYHGKEHQEYLAKLYAAKEARAQRRAA